MSGTNATTSFVNLFGDDKSDGILTRQRSADGTFYYAVPTASTAGIYNYWSDNSDFASNISGLSEQQQGAANGAFNTAFDGGGATAAGFSAGGLGGFNDLGIGSDFGPGAETGAEQTGHANTSSSLDGTGMGADVTGNDETSLIDDNGDDNGAVGSGGPGMAPIAGNFQWNTAPGEAGQALGASNGQSAVGQSAFDATAFDSSVFDVTVAPPSNWDSTGQLGAVSAPAAPATLATLAKYLNDQNAPGNDFWDDRGVSKSPFFNLTTSGINAKSGVIHYNVTSFPGTDSDGTGTASRVDSIRDALNVYEDILGINFVETTSTNTNYVDLFFYDNVAGKAFANFNQGSDGSISYAWVNVATNWNGGTSGAIGDYTFQTYLHEIGHTLGLGHQGDYNAGSGSPTYANSAQWQNDTWQQTMMSYWNQSNYNGQSNVKLIGPMAVDWLALENLYGAQGYGVANGTTTGDTTWGFNSSWFSWTQSSSGPAQGYANNAYAALSSMLDTNAVAIVDGGGIDTLDLSGFNNNTVIDVSEALATSTTGSISSVAGKTGNLTIAVGTIIENVVGGAGAETIYGNNAANNLKGNGGNDTVYGYNGNDMLIGGSGNDVLHGGNNNDTLVGGAGTDSLYGENGNDTFQYTVADAPNGLSESINGGTGSDRILLTGAGTFAFGNGFNAFSVEEIEFKADGSTDKTLTMGNKELDSATEFLNVLIDGNDSSGADDTIRISLDYTDSVTLAGWTFLDWRSASAAGANNTDRIYITGNGNANTITGSSEDDIIRGGAGTDTLNGGAGNDVLIGGSGQDSLDGGAGTDTADYSVTGFAGNFNLATDSAAFAGFYTETLTSIENLIGGSGNDTITGDSGANVLDGSSGNDTISGGGGADTLKGGFGNDVLIGGSGQDSFDGGSGTDTADYTGTFFAGNFNLATDSAYFSGFYTETLTSIENLVGGNLNDTITGDTGANVLDGSSGNDLINGGAGDDTINGGLGNDTISGGSGVDVMNGDAGDDTFLIHLGWTGGVGESMNGGVGTDTFDTTAVNSINANVDLAAGAFDFGFVTSGTIALTSIENVITGNGADTVTGDTSANTITTGSGNDVIDGGAGDDTINGGLGNDTISGGDGVDVMNGDAGDDTFLIHLGWGGGPGESMNGGAGTDTFDTTAVSAINANVNLGGGAGTFTYTYGTPATVGVGTIALTSIENVNTGTGNDTVTGNSSVNVINTGAGNDTLIQTSNIGSDILNGGADTDTLVWDQTWVDSVLFDLTLGRVVFFGSNYDTLVGIENVTVGGGADVTGNGSANHIVATDMGASSNNTFLGLAGNDTLDGGIGDDSLFGGSGNDTINDGAGGDVVSGGAGNDLLLAGDSDFSSGDSWDGGVGTDTLSFQNFNWGTPASPVVFDLEAGTASSGGFTETITNIERFIGSDGDETINGSSIANVLTGLGGDDVLSGLAGNDTLKGGSGSDTIEGGTEKDRLIGGSGSDLLKGGAGGDVIRGGGYADTIRGNDGNDRLRGDAGNDSINGGRGNDWIDGGSGDDTLVGGLGKDQFVFKSGGGLDKIIDFEDNRDTLVLDEALWGGGLTATEVITNYASTNGNTVIFDFNGTDIIKLFNFGPDETLLTNDLAFV